MEVESVTEICGGAMLTLTGMGPRSASRCSQRLLDRGANALLSWGSAAGLHESLKPGHLVLPECVLTADLSRRFVDPQWHRKLYAALEDQHLPCTAPLVESRAVLASSTQKRELGKRSGAIAADMESAAIAEVAHRANLPFMVIRAVSDSVEYGIPQHLIQATDAIGRIRWQDILVLIALRPWKWSTAIRLGWGFHSAMTTLRRVVESVDRALLFSPQI